MYVRAIATSPNISTDGILFVGIDNRDSGNPTSVVFNGQSIPTQGLFRSTNAGTSLAPTSLAGPPISTIAPSPNFTNDHTVFASSPVSGLFKSIDGGISWSNIVVTTAETAILETDISPNFTIDHTVLAASSHSGIFKSVDGGSTWNKIPGSDLLTGLNMAFSPAYASDNTIFFGTMQQGLLKSADGGQTLTPTGLPNAFVMNVVLSPNYGADRTIFATTYQGAYVSNDGGATWAYTFNPARMEQDRTGNIWSVGETPVAVSAPNASTSAVYQYSLPGTVVNITFTGSSVKLLVGTASDQGDVQITLDGASQGVYSLNSATPQWQVPVWSTSNLACAVHKVTLTLATSSAGKTGMKLDAIDYGRETCPN
jgi:hypothetical protein